MEEEVIFPAIRERLPERMRAEMLQRNAGANGSKGQGLAD